LENRLNITPYESRILLLLKQGLANKNISFKVGLSENTVKYHLKNIYKKLGAKNRIEAINKFNELIN
jgi:DNA-binding NarL/FixJ family response regulator